MGIKKTHKQAGKQTLVGDVAGKRWFIGLLLTSVISLSGNVIQLIHGQNDIKPEVTQISNSTTEIVNYYNLDCPNATQSAMTLRARK